MAVRGFTSNPTTFEPEIIETEEKLVLLVLNNS